MGRRAVLQLRIYSHLGGRCALDVVECGKLSHAAKMDRCERTRLPGVHVLQCHGSVRIRMGALPGPERVCRAGDAMEPRKLTTIDVLPLPYSKCDAKTGI